MATTNATIDVRVTGQASLDKLGTSLDGLHRRMLGLRSVVAGLGFAALGRSALQMADDLQDLSNASGIATGNLLEFKKALETSGGQADQMANGITKFAQSIDEAAQGSQKAIYSFQTLGVSLGDLQNLSERDLLIKTLEGISKLPNASERAAAMMDKFGKSFKTVDPGELAAKLVSTAGSMDAYAATVKRAADLQDGLATSAGTLKLAFLEAFSGPIDRMVQFNKDLEDGRAKLDALVTIMKTLAVVAVAALSFTGWLAVVRIIGGLGRGIGAITGLFSGLGATITSVFQAGGAAMTALRYVGGIVAAIGAGIAAVIGLRPAEAKPPGPTAPSPEEAAAAAKQKAEEDKRRKINLENQKREIMAIRDVTSEYEKQFRMSNARAFVEADLIGKSEEEKNIQLALFDLAQKFLDVQDQLLKKKRDLKEEDSYLIPTINAQIKANAELYSQQVAQVQQVISRQMVNTALEQDRKNILEAITKQLERQSVLAEQLVNANDRMQEIRFESTTMGMSPLAKGMAQIQEENRKASLAASRSFAAQFADMDLTTQQANELAAGLAQIAERYNQIASAQMANLEQSRTFAEGWKAAFNEYADAAYNAADYAKNIFATTTKGMEDMIVNFAKTGKLEFKSFISSIVEQILRSQIQQLLTQSFRVGGGSSGGGSILGDLFTGAKSLFGFANGGMIPTNSPVLVGERGPEILTGAAGRNVIPNNALGGSTVTYIINAVDAPSFQALVARDPGFIHAVAEQGRRNMPLTRR